MLYGFFNHAIVVLSLWNMLIFITNFNQCWLSNSWDILGLVLVYYHNKCIWYWTQTFLDGTAWQFTTFYDWTKSDVRCLIFLNFVAKNGKFAESRIVAKIHLILCGNEFPKPEIQCFSQINVRITSSSIDRRCGWWFLDFHYNFSAWRNSG